MVDNTTYRIQAEQGHNTYNSGWFNWFYQLLDVSYGVDIAVQDVRSIRTPQALKLALYLDLVLLAAMAGIWWRFDLYSTFDFFTPTAGKITESVPADWQWLASWAGRLIGTLFPTLVQWRYPSMARKHQAAWLILVAAVLFDMWTDYPDIHNVLIPITVGQVVDLAHMNWLLRFAVEFVGILVASFAAQSMTVIQFAKVMVIRSRLGEF